MTNDVIADTLTRIRNAVLRSHAEVVLQSTQAVKALIEILKQEGYLESFQEKEVKVNLKGEVKRRLIAKLKFENKIPLISHMERVSKPGLRIYMGYQDIPKVLNGLGISIFSTSKGIMTGRVARSEKVGGEYLCKIW